SRLMGASIGEVQRDRIGMAALAAERWSSTGILKGAGAGVADPAGSTAGIPTGNPGRAAGGTGGRLAGRAGAGPGGVRRAGAGLGGSRRGPRPAWGPGSTAAPRISPSG